MGHVFMPRIFEPPVIAEPIAVTITRTYSSSGRPIVVNGTSYTSSGTASTTVLAGDVISFTIGGLTVTDSLKIDGTTVASVASVDAGGEKKIYTWTVPDGISSITIEDNGRSITVTTS